MQLTNFILVLIYLLSGTVLSGYSRISIQSGNSISKKSNLPRQHYLSNQRLQKHIAPNLQNENLPDTPLKPVSGECQPKIAVSQIELPAVKCFASADLRKLTNKAPPHRFLYA